MAKQKMTSETLSMALEQERQRNEDAQRKVASLQEQITGLKELLGTDAQQVQAERDQIEAAKRSADYLVDDEEVEYAKLLAHLATPRYAKTQRKFRVILEVLRELGQDGASSSELLSALQAAGETLEKKQLTGLITNQFNQVAGRYNFQVQGKGKHGTEYSYFLSYTPPCRAIIFFNMFQSNQATALRDALLLIDQCERSKLDQEKLKILEVGAVSGEFDIYVKVEAEKAESILTALDRIFNDSKQVVTLSGKRLRACDMIQLSRTFIVNPGLYWERKERHEAKKRKTPSIESE